MANPRNIVPVLSADEQSRVAKGGIAAPALPNLVFHQGRVLTAVKVFTIFWGAAWSQPPHDQEANTVNQFFDFILTSSLMNLLATEYSVSGHTIGHGSRIGSVTVGTPPLGGKRKRITDAQIQQQLGKWIAQGTIPQPTDNTLYFVYLPPGVTAVASDKKRSCSDFCGYHGSVKGGGVLYAVEPYVTCAGCGFGNGVVDSLTKVSSHELCEAITDPAGSGWYDDATGNEIGDICNTEVTQLGPYTVQKEWSDSQKRCVVA